MSATSSDVEVNYLNKTGKKIDLENKNDKKPSTSESTDMYFNLIANPEKLKSDISENKETTE